jgi:hypothetical protein
MIDTIHVGKGTFIGSGVTVFPVWTTGNEMTNVCFKTKHLTVTEVEGGPDVNLLSVTNNGHRDHVVVEGDIFEGGWQNRVAACTIVIPRGHTIEVPVACVEQGRWHGTHQHGRQVRRAPYRTRARLNANLEMNLLSGLADASAVQGDVWDDISRFERTRGPVAGHSLALSMEQVEDDHSTPVHITLLPGQRGVIIGIGGYIAAAEIFGSHEALEQRFDAIVNAARYEGLDAQNRSTPNYLARDFASILERSHIETRRDVPERVETPVGPLAITSYALAAGLVHAAAFNIQHSEM